MKLFLINALTKLANTGIYLKANILKMTVLSSNALNLIHKAITEEDIIATKEVKSLNDYILLLANKELDKKSKEYSLVKAKLLESNIIIFFISPDYMRLHNRESELLKEIKQLKDLIKIKKEK